MRTLLTIIAALALACVAVPAAADVDPFIVGGRPATEAYPFTASMQTTRGDHFCGGVLIRADWVVTARHCVEHKPPSSMRVRVGSLDRTSGGTVVNVSRIVDHPSSDSDVSVVQLTTAVGYQPIQIAGDAPVGSPLRLLGWGLTCDPCDRPPPVVLQELDTTILPDSRCGTGTAELCVGNVDGWRGPCYGDSGGPAVVKVAHRWQVAGTTTSDTSAYCGQGPSIYLDSTTHREWIDGVIGGGSPLRHGRNWHSGE